MKFTNRIWIKLSVLLLIVSSTPVLASETITGRLLTVEFSQLSQSGTNNVVTVIVDVLTHGESPLPSADPNHLAGKIIIAECRSAANKPQAADQIRQSAAMMKASVEHNWKTIVDMTLLPKPSVTGIPTFTLQKLVLPTPNNYSQLTLNCSE